MKFSENLRNIRKEKDYSQEYLAEAMGVSRQTVSKWENGSAMPDLKKMTELAELLGTNMDTLLGLESAPRAEKTADVDLAPYIEHTERLFEAMNDSRQKATEKKYNTLITVMCIIMAAVFILLSVRISHLSSEVSSLRSEVDMLRAEVGSVSYDSDDDDEDSDLYIETTLLGCDSEKPWLADVRFTYAPENYANATTVSYTLINHDGSSKKVDAEKKNEAFVAEVTLDMTLFDSATVSVNDGTATQTQDCTPDLTWDYLNPSGNPAYAEKIDSLFMSNGYHYEFKATDTIFFSDAISGKITEARLVFKSNDKELHSEKLEIHPSEEKGQNLSVNITDVSFNTDKYYDSIEVQLELTGENGVRYILPNSYNMQDDATYYDEYVIIVFTIDGKEFEVNSH